MKKHNIVKVVLITILVLALLTWILPAAYFSSEVVEQGRVQMGIFDLFNYPVTAVSYFGHIALFILLVGGFYGILYEIPAYGDFLVKASDKLKKKGKLVLSIMMILLAIITSVCGLQIGLIVFFPMLVSIIILMGYNNIVAALVLVGSTIVGLAGNTVAYSNSSILLTTLGLDITSSLLTKIIILVLGLVLLIFNTIVYIRKSEVLSTSKKSEDTKSSKKSVEAVSKIEEKATSKKSASKTTGAKKVSSAKAKTTKATKTTKTAKSTKTSKSSRKDIKAAVKGDDVLVIKDQLSEEDYLVPKYDDNKKHSIWPFIVSFALLFVIMILAFISWANAFKITAFTKATTSVLQFKLFGFPIFGKLLGTVNEFGAWTIIDITVVMFVIALFLTFVYKIKFEKVVDGFVKGLKKALPLGLIVILIYTCLVITTYHPFQLVIYKALFGLSNKLDALIAMIVGLLSGVFNVEPLYSFQSVIPYLVSTGVDTSLYPVVGILFQAIYGLAMLIAPTSVILMCVLSYLNISYTKWIKTVWSLFLQLFGVFAILFVISGMKFLSGLIVIVPLAILILMIVAYWKVFEKANRKGYAAIIPFYNYYTLFEIAGYNGWLSLLMLLPVVNIVFMILVDIKIAKKFGKGTGFIVGLILLPFIFYMILAFDNSKYSKNK